MARANLHFVSGQVRYLTTHRCHKREFLLKFVKDRRRWLKWLYKAKKRYGLVILNYVVTSNHIHLVVYGKDSSETISKSVQLLAGRTGQEYNQRKNCKGAFWRDESWTQSIAIGNRSYIESVKRQLGGNAMGRKIRELSEGFELWEPKPVYNALFGGKNDDIHAENCLFWNV